MTSCCERGVGGRGIGGRVVGQRDDVGACVTPTAPGVTETMLAAELEPITLITESKVTGIEYAARNTAITPTFAA